MSKIALYEIVENHVAPNRAHDDDVGFDMTAYSVTFDKENRYYIVDLGTRFALPPGSWAQLYARSSLADLGWRLVNSVGIIDNGYRGPLKAKLEKRHEDAVKLKAGEVYVQFVIYPNPFISVKEGKVTKDTSRGEGGFGSTTKKKVADVDDDTKTKKSSKKDEEEPKKKSSKKTVADIEDDDEEEPKKRSSKKNADDEEEPKKKSSKKKVVDDDEEEPKKRSSKKKTEDDEEEPKKRSSKKKTEDDEEEPKKKSSKKKADNEEATTKKKTSARGRASAE